MSSQKATSNSGGQGWKRRASSQWVLTFIKRDEWPWVTVPKTNCGRHYSFMQKISESGLGDGTNVNKKMMRNILRRSEEKYCGKKKRNPSSMINVVLSLRRTSMKKRAFLSLIWPSLEYTSIMHILNLAAFLTLCNVTKYLDDFIKGTIC